MQKVRSILVLLVAVLLIGGTPLAAACGMACNEANSSCASAATGYMAMSRHCEHCQEAALGTQHCATTTCASVALLRERQEDRSFHVQPLANMAQAVSFSLAPGAFFRRVEPPKSPPVAPVLSVPLRI